MAVHCAAGHVAHRAASLPIKPRRSNAYAASNRCKSGHTRDLCQPPNRKHIYLPSTSCSAYGDWSDKDISGENASKTFSLDTITCNLDAFYRFTRPHTMMGTTISIISVSLLALQGQTLTQQAVLAVVQALTAALLANISIVGLNQVFDVEIDRVNKPYLPLASGDFSLSTGIAIVLITAAGAMLSGLFWGSPALAWTVGISLVLGILYSTELPFMRWKRFPFLAAACILSVRAIIVQLGFYLHIKQVLATAQITLTRPLIFTVAFMLLFSVVIALFKDIPDVKGDDQAGVKTASVRLGVPRVFWTCVTLLMVAYSGGVVFGMTSGSLGSAAVTCVGHAAAAALLWSRSKAVNLGKKGELVDHYMFIWKLFYAEYLFIPFLR